MYRADISATKSVGQTFECLLVALGTETKQKKQWVCLLPHALYRLPRFLSFSRMCFRNLRKKPAIS